MAARLDGQGQLRATAAKAVAASGQDAGQDADGGSVNGVGLGEVDDNIPGERVGHPRQSVGKDGICASGTVRFTPENGDGAGALDEHDRGGERIGRCGRRR